MKHLIMFLFSITLALPALATSKEAKKQKNTRKPASVEWKTGHLNVFVGGGIRTGKSDEDQVHRIKAGVLGARVSFFELKLKDQNTVSLFSPGFNVQTNGDLSLSVAPLAITLEDRIYMGVDYYPFLHDGNDQGRLGIFIGVRFGADGFDF